MYFICEDLLLPSIICNEYLLTNYRTTETLKKQWGKLKSEAKTYKAASRRSVSGTGGGPSKKYDDPVLELVVEITGRASTGITNIEDCDAESEVDPTSR